MSSWKEDFNFGECPSVSHDVNGEPQDFHPISVGLLFKLKKLAGPVANAFTVLMSKSPTDTSHSQTQGQPFVLDGQVVREGEGEDSQVLRSETVFETFAVSPDLAEFRSRERREAIEVLMNALTDTKNQELFARIIMNSLKIRNVPASEFLDQVPSTALPDMLIGVAKANKGVLGPLAPKLGKAASLAQLKLTSVMEEENPEGSEEEE